MGVWYHYFIRIVIPIDAFLLPKIQFDSNSIMSKVGRLKSIDFFPSFLDLLLRPVSGEIFDERNKKLASNQIIISALS